jgi:hypothetical protein
MREGDMFMLITSYSIISGIIIIIGSAAPPLEFGV